MGNYLLSRAKYLLTHQGLPTLIKNGASFLLRSVFSCGTFTLYEHPIIEFDEKKHLPRINDVTFVIVSGEEQVRELADQGFENICRTRLVPDPRKCLASGAIAFCFFVDKELAHIGWVGLSEEAKNSFDDIPYFVDFSHGQACTGGVVTIPKYGGNGLMAYNYYKRLEFLRQKGYKTSRNAVRKGNTVSEKMNGKFAPRIFTEARLIKLFGKRIYWKQTPLD